MKTSSIFAVCKPFTNAKRDEYEFIMTDAGIKVFDHIAGFFTGCHSLPLEDQDKLRNLFNNHESKTGFIWITL